MKLWGKLSETSFRFLAKPYLHTFEERSPESTLTRSLNLLNDESIDSLKIFVIGRQTASGGFSDRAGRADLYYSLFGLFVSEALGMKEVMPGLRRYVESEILRGNIGGVHLHCAAILSSKLNCDNYNRSYFIDKLRVTSSSPSQQPAYHYFLNLLSSWYLNDYAGLLLISRKLKSLESESLLPCPVLAAYTVLRKSFRKNVEGQKADLLSYLKDNGGFKAVHNAPVSDLLSTAVAVYALRFAGHDLRTMKPGCLEYIDSLFGDGGFGGNEIDTETDIEYTFYGLLALGSLAD